MKNIDDFPFLFQFQKQDVEELLHGKVLFSNPVGTGKSITSLVYCQCMDYKKVLIIAPSPLKQNWAAEITKFLKVDYMILEGSLKERKSLFDKYKNNETKYLIINYEMLNSRNIFLYDYFFPCILLDEVHRIKNHKSKTYKYAKKLQSGHRIGLSATPLTNTPVEIYAIVNFLRPFFFKYDEFINDYAIIGVLYYNVRWHKEVTGPVAWKNLDDLYKRIEPIMIRREKKDVLPDLPEVTYKDYYINLSEYEMYLNNFYFVKMRESFMKEDNMMFSYLSLLQQLACGCRLLSMTSSENLIQLTKDDNSKLKALKEILEDLGNERVLIFTKFERMTRIIKNEIGDDKCFIISGDTKNKIQAIEDFKNSDKQYLVATDCLNWGVNIEFLHILINFDLSFTPAKMEQRNGRIARMTQENKMLVINLIAKGTYEEKIVKILEEKSELFDKVVLGINNKELIKALCVTT